MVSLRAVAAGLAMSSRMVEGAGVPIAVTEVGDGPPVLLLHDIGSDAADLAPIAAALAGRARVIAPDRRGYGDSGAPEPYQATTVSEQAQDAAAVLHALDAGPAIVAGIGFGALIGLDLLVRHRDTVAAAVLVDPPLFAFVAEATAALSAQRLMLEEALREGGSELAVARWLGPAADPGRLARAQRAQRAFYADLGGLASWPVTRATLRAITAPTTVVTSADTPAHVVLAAEALTGLLPRATRDEQGDIVAAVTRALAG